MSDEQPVAGPQPIARLFDDVESRAKQAAALRELAACVERGEVYAVISLVVGNGGPKGPRSEVSEWRDIDQEDVRNPERNRFIGEILVHHLRIVADDITRKAIVAAFPRGQA